MIKYFLYAHDGIEKEPPAHAQHPFIWNDFEAVKIPCLGSTIKSKVDGASVKDTWNSFKEFLIPPLSGMFSFHHLRMLPGNSN